jgi:thioredoxin 1
MGVDNLAEYVAHHRATRTSLSPNPAPASAPAPAPATATRNRGVLTIGSKSAYESEILGADPQTLVVLDFFATWCGPCKVIAPKVSKFSDDYPQAKFFKVDVDEAVDVAQELGIRAMPTFLLFKNGKKVSEIVGANERALEAAIQMHL